MSNRRTIGEWMTEDKIRVAVLAPYADGTPEVGLVICEHEPHIKRISTYLTPTEARKLAGLLIDSAEEIEGTVAQ